MNKPNIAKRSARSVNRRIAEDGSTWPIELYAIARECGHELDMVPRQERYMEHRVFSDFITIRRSIDSQPRSRSLKAGNKERFTKMNWILGYLLTGFLISWVGFQVLKIPPNKSSWWELAACVLWPLTLLCALVQKLAR